MSSFAGGRTLEVTAYGLTSDIILGRSEVRVCEKPCKRDADKSNASVFSCTVPEISTLKSDSEFNIHDESTLKGEKIIYGGMTKEMAEKTLDDQILPSVKSSQAGCFVGV